MKASIRPASPLLAFVFLLLLALPSGRLQAQDSLPADTEVVICRSGEGIPYGRLQVNLQLVQFNLAQPYAFNVRSRNVIQPFSGLMLSYRLHRWGIRVGGSFSRDVTNNDGRNCFDCGDGEMHGYDYSVRAGGQFSLAEGQNAWYIFGDLYYRYYQGEGIDNNLSSNYFPYRFKQTESGIGGQVGMGLRIKLYRNLSFLTEGYFANERYAFTYHSPQSGFPHYIGSYASLLNPGARLYLSMLF